MIENYLRVLRRRWQVLVAVVMCAVVGAGVVSVLSPTTYQSTLTMYTSVTTGQGDAGVVYQASLLAQERTRQYVQMIGTTRVAQEIVHQAGLSESPETVASWVKASSALESVIINVTVTAPSADLASEVANGVGSVFPQFLPAIDKRPADVATPINVEVIDSASKPKSQLAEALVFNVILGALVGLLVGTAAALVVDGRARRRAETAHAREAEIELAESEYLVARGIPVRVVGDVDDAREGSPVVDGEEIRPDPAPTGPTVDGVAVEKDPGPRSPAQGQPTARAEADQDDTSVDVDLFVRPGQRPTVDPSAEETVKIKARNRLMSRTAKGRNNGHNPVPPVTADTST